jgi:nucleotide-binding universal stress UspA family protein
MPRDFPHFGRKQIQSTIMPTDTCRHLLAANLSLCNPSQSVVIKITFIGRRLREYKVGWRQRSRHVLVRKPTPTRYYQIVVPTDFSPSSTRAMKFAMNLARPGARVTAVHVVDPFPYKFGPQELSQLGRQQAWASAQSSMLNWLREGKFRTAEMTIIDGEPAPALAEFVCSNHTDLLVLGTSARRHGQRILLGSVAEEIFREIGCPVVVIGPKARFRKNLKKVRLMFATDLAPHSLAVLSQLSKLSARFHSEVAVLRAVPHHADIPGTRKRLQKEMREKLWAAADQKLRRRIKNIKIEFSTPAKGILNVPNRLHADAIVMGIRSGGELSRAATHIPWTLAHRVIAEAKCPVITIRG